MQTFLPVPSAYDTARILDRRRLGKQRIEALQILRTLQGKSLGWVNHPVVKMWRGHEHALAIYGWVMCDEWIRRGYKDTCLPHFVEAMKGRDAGTAVLPNWIGSASFHESHQSNLVRKFPEHYRKFFPDIPDNLPYVWPM